MLIEPADHALGRSRGGLGTKIHQLSDGNGRPMVLLIGPGHAGDSPMFPVVMRSLSVPRLGPGRPRTRLRAVLGDKDYSSKANRALLRARGIEAVIAEPDCSPATPHHAGRARVSGQLATGPRILWRRRGVSSRVPHMYASTGFMKPWSLR